MLLTSTFGVLANIVMAVMVYGTKILGYLFKYPWLSEEDKTQKLATKDSGNLNIRAVMAHIMGKTFSFDPYFKRRPCVLGRCTHSSYSYQH